jgi:hypothetical protein
MNTDIRYIREFFKRHPMPWSYECSVIKRHGETRDANENIVSNKEITLFVAHIHFMVEMETISMLKDRYCDRN